MVFLRGRVPGRFEFGRVHRGIFPTLERLTCRRTLRAKIVERAQSDGVQALEGSLLSKKSGVCCGETP